MNTIHDGTNFEVELDEGRPIFKASPEIIFKDGDKVKVIMMDGDEQIGCVVGVSREAMGEFYSLISIIRYDHGGYSPIIQVFRNLH